LHLLDGEIKMHDDGGHILSIQGAEGTGLRLRLFGLPEARIGEAALTLRDQKAQALLFYLAATGQAASRDHLATLLWSESPEGNARHSLRSSLYHLRQSLDAGTAATLLVNRNLVHLRLREGVCDVLHFRHLIAANGERELAEAVALYHGPLLEGFSLADAPVFEEWLRAEQASLSRAYLNTLAHLASWAEAREAWGDAIVYAQRIIQEDALDEVAQRHLMRLYLRSGATVQALRQYQRFEAELKRELGLAPSVETQELFQQALQPAARHPAPPVATLIPRSEQAEASWDVDEWALPFVGRDDLLKQFLALSEAARAGHGSTVLLHGETGMGKTRLLSELEARQAAQSPAWIVLHGSCSPFDDLVAFGPFYDALQSAVSGDLTDLLAVDQGSAREETGTVSWRILQALQLLAQGGPLLLAIDDLHWANSSTLHLFGFLATHLRKLPILLVGTIERADAIPAVQRLLALGRTRGDIHLVPVGPLAPAAVIAWLHTLGLSLDAAISLAEWLQAHSGGSPFMLGEILAQLRADTILTPGDNGWHLNEGRWLRRRVSFTLPETTYDLVSWRLASLPPDALHLLDVLAVASQPLPFALLHDFPGIEGDSALLTAEDLLAKGLLVEAADEALALSHHVLRETVLARMSHLRRRMLHRQLLEAIERCSALQARFPLRQVALHAVAAEDADRARRYGPQVLDDLLQDTPSAEMLDFARRLHDLLAPSATTAEMLRLTSALGQLHQSLGQLEAAARWHQERLEIARAAGDLSAQVIVHFEMGELALVTSDYLAATEAAHAGLALCQTPVDAVEAGLAGRGYRLLGAALAMEGHDLPAAERYLRQAVAAHRSAGNSDDLCAVLFELGNVAAQRGDLTRALDNYAEAGRTAEAAHVYYYHALAHNNHAYHSLLLGRLEAAQTAAAQGLRVAEAHELVGALLHLYSTLGEVRLYLAEWARAADWFNRGLTLADELGNLERQAGYRAGLALAARGEGNAERATALLEEADTLIAGQGHEHLHTRIQHWLAETWLLRGNAAEAAPYLNAALATTRTQERSLLLVQNERLHAQLLAYQGQWSEAAALFADAVELATRLGLPLEIARTQAAWGEAAMRSAPSPQTGHNLLLAAHATFAALDARADIQALDMVLQQR
jgi:DNA-binding SARP family transcriptional activator/tetratricopeptide (TPR) repeat protein